MVQTRFSAYLASWKHLLGIMEAPTPQRSFFGWGDHLFHHWTLSIKYPLLMQRYLGVGMVLRRWKVAQQGQTFLNITWLAFLFPCQDPQFNFKRLCIEYHYFTKNKHLRVELGAVMITNHSEQLSFLISTIIGHYERIPLDIRLDHYPWTIILNIVNHFIPVYRGWLWFLISHYYNMMFINHHLVESFQSTFIKQ